MMNKKTLCLAVAATIGAFGASQANAALSTNASELPAASVIDPSTGTWQNVLTHFNPTSSNALYIAYTLSSGAYFSSGTTPALTCAEVGSETTAGTLQAGGAANNVATFVVTAAAGQITACTLTVTSVSASGWPENITLQASATYGNNVVPATTYNTGLLTYQSMFNNVVTAGTSTQAKVASAYISFTAGATTATIGAFDLSVTATKLVNSTAANSPGTVSTFASAITVSLSGTPLTAGHRVYITQNAGTMATCAGTPVVSAAGAASITMSGFAIDTGNAIEGYAVCMEVTGAVVPAGTITVGVTGVPGTDANTSTSYQVSTLIASGTTLGTITHDGASTTVLNLPPSTNADTGYLRVYNTSSLTGALTATVYDQSGTALGTSNCTLDSSLAGGAVYVTSAASLETTCGITPPSSGRYKVVLNGAFSSMRAQALARTGSSGVLVNLSADTSGAGN